MYWKPNNWKVLSQKVCHFYDDDATPINVVCVQIGYNGKNPVIRWITAKEYEKYMRG
jgi:hypothetical protein